MASRVCTLLFAAWLLLLGGCATITKGSSQTVTINTDPNGAMCMLNRDGKQIAVVNPTPGSIPIESRAAPSR